MTMTDFTSKPSDLIFFSPILYPLMLKYQLAIFLFFAKFIVIKMNQAH